MSRPRQKGGFPRPTGFESVASTLRRTHGDLIVSERKLKQADEIQIVSVNRDAGTENVGFVARPFVLCGLPVRRPTPGELLFERRNGHFVLSVTGHPRYGLPWGQDRLVPIFLATLAVKQRTQTITFRSAAELLDTFGLPQGGTIEERMWHPDSRARYWRRRCGCPVGNLAGGRTLRPLACRSLRHGESLWFGRQP